MVQLLHAQLDSKTLGPVSGRGHHVAPAEIASSVSASCGSDLVNVLLGGVVHEGLFEFGHKKRGPRRLLELIEPLRITFCHLFLLVLRQVSVVRGEAEGNMVTFRATFRKKERVCPG